MEHYSEQFLKEVVYRAIESDELDYKAAQSWNALTRTGRGKIVRHLIALANTKGGFLVIGVGEDRAGKPSLYTGLTDEESASFDPSAVGTFVNRCVEPPIDFTIERPVIDGKRFAIFIVKPFNQLPHVCCNSVDTELASGVFYIRTPEASSRPAARAVELHQLIQRAMRNQRGQLAKMLRGLLYESGTIAKNSDVQARFDDLINSSAEYFRHRKNPGKEACILQLSAIPDAGDSAEFALTELRKAAEEAWRWQPGIDFFDHENIDNAYITNVSLRFMATEADWMWQAFKSGLFHCIGAFPPGDTLNAEVLRSWCLCIAGFLGRFYANLGWQEEQLRFRVELLNVEGMKLDCGKGTPGVCRINDIQFEFCRSSADLSAGSAAHGARILRGIGERFNLDDDQLSLLTAPCFLENCCR
ncbi:MAG: ATP-binding protein [Lentisphaerae bacterium]|nr:ATP-binding protein [Lentisphaerota bacterium]